MLARRQFVAGAMAAAAMPTTPAYALPDAAAPALRRQYLDCAFGQLHVRVAHPRDGRLLGAPPLVLLHQSPLSGRMYDRILPLLADRRLAIAVDTPGYGESDRPAERPALDAYGDTIVDAIRDAFGAPVDLFGYHTGAAIAVDIAARRPDDVRRLVLIAVPYFDARRRIELLQQFERKNGYADDGSHLLPLWTGTFRARPPGQSLDDVARLVAEKQRAGRHGEWALAAAMAVDMGPALARVRAATLVMAPHDGLEDESAAAAAAIGGARFVDLPQLRYGLFDADPARVAGVVIPFLDA
jgi:pimeloyl-ACP methyl ester carboxylesterase